MKYQERKNLLESATNQPSNVTRKYWIKIIDSRCELHRVNDRMKLKRTMINSVLFDYFV